VVGRDFEEERSARDLPEEEGIRGNRKESNGEIVLSLILNSDCSIL
jgi:hypothetical protein